MNVVKKIVVIGVLIKLTKKKFEVKLGLLKIGAPNQFGHMLPYYKEQLMWHLIFLRMIPCTSQINIILLKKIFYFNKFLVHERML